MIASGLILASALQPGALTEDFGVMRLDKLIQQVAAKTGWPLKASSNQKSDFVYVNAKAMGLEDFKESLTLALNGKWSESDGVWQLVLPPKNTLMGTLRGSAIEAFFKKPRDYTPMSAEQARSFVKKAEDMAEKTQSTGQWDSAGYRELSAANPMSRALGAVAQALGKSFFESFPEEGRVVFSSQPTRMQRPFPPRAAAILEQARRDAKMLQTAVSQFSRGDQFNQFTYMFQSDLGDLSGFDIVVDDSESGPTLTLRAKTPTSGGSATLGTLSLLQAAAEDQEVYNEENLMKRSPFSDLTGEMPLSQKAKDLFDAFGPSRSALDFTKAPELAAALRNPEARDFLDVVWDEPLDLVVAKTGKGLVTNVPDLSMLIMMGTKPSYASVGMSMSFSLVGFRGGSLDTRGQNTIIVPVGPGGVDTMRVSRSALSRLYNELNSPKAMLDVMAGYALTRPNMIERQLASRLLFGNSGFSAMGQEKNMKALRIYGLLGPQEARKAASGGVRIPLAQIQGELRRELEAAVFSTNVPINPKSSADQDTIRVEGMTEFDDPFSMSRYSYQSADWASDPTRALQDGFPMGSSVLVKVDVKPIWFAQQKAQSGFNLPPMPMSLSSIAYTMVMKEKAPDQFEQWGAEPQTLVQGESAMLNLSFDFGNIGSTSLSSVVDDFRTFSKPIKFSEMPPAMKKAFDEAVAEARKRYADGSFVLPGGRNTKPPQ